MQTSRKEFIDKINQEMENLGYPKGKRKVLYTFQIEGKKYRLVFEKRRFPCGVSIRTTLEEKNKDGWVRSASMVQYK